MKFAMAVCFVMTLIAGSAQGAVSKQPFGKTPDGTAVEVYTLKNEALEARIITYGAILVSLNAPDRHGKAGDVLLGYDTLEGYLHDKSYLGAIVGRYGNRIANATFPLEGKTYTLPKNDGENTLHGGTHGFNQAVWKAKETADGVELTHVSPDGDQGFPGTLTTTVRYSLHGHELRIEYSATTDKPTVVNLTNHAYFNLSGEADILKHHMRLFASHYTPVSASLIPTGEIAPVAGTPFDFTKATAIGDRIDADNEQIRRGRGYDHNWVLDRSGKAGALEPAAEAYDPSSGRVLEVLTDQPGVQFYSGNFLDGAKGKGGRAYNRRAAFCLETQHFPDSPNHPKFPSTELKPGQQYHTVTVFRFSAR